MMRRLARRSLLDVLPRSALAVACATVLMTLVVASPLDALRPLIAPIALIAPGYGLLLALHGPEMRLDGPVALALAGMLSLTAYALLGLALHVLSIPLSRASVGIGVDLVVAPVLVVVLLRWRGATPLAWPRSLAALGVRHPSAPIALAAAGRSGGAPHSWVGAYAAAGGIALALLLVVTHASSKPVPAPYSSLALAGSWAHIHGIVQARTGADLAVAVRVSNQTHAAQRYSIVPALDGAAPWRTATVAVGPDLVWSGLVRGAVPADGCLHRLTIALRRGKRAVMDGPLVIWVRGGGRSAACGTAYVAH